MLVLEWGLGWGGTERCTGMLVQMNTDDDKVDQTELNYMGYVFDLANHC